MQGADPVRIRLVDSLSHPGGNLTGINLFLAEVAAKRFEFLLVLVPGARSVAYLRNPTNPVFAESESREVEAAARSFGVKLVFFDASDSSGIERAFRDIVQQRMGRAVCQRRRFPAHAQRTDPDARVVDCGAGGLRLAPGGHARRPDELWHGLS
jgi:putative tryptophan/tyrosine transport system substrate-binding protein